MKRGATATAVRATDGSSGPVAFRVRDATGQSCAFTIDTGAFEALVFGTAGTLRVTAAGVLPAHFVVMPHDGMLVAASASAMKPALLDGAALPTTWTILEVPARIRIGAAVIDFFFVHESGTIPRVPRDVDDVEVTVAEMPPARRSATRTKLPPITPPKLRPPQPRPRLVLVPSVPGAGDDEPTPHVLHTVRESTTTLRARARGAIIYLQIEWSKASTTTRVLVGVMAILFAFLVARAAACAPP